ncbi:MAG TPA: DUF58 domain-containing protein [Planctomycetota bacterium]|nr:DUF58 domain-containing protein [Planctomycetota bacterium]
MFDADFLRRLEYLDVVARKILQGRIRAERMSTKRGTSVEFEDYRNYAPGDDLRYLDWNVFGRLEELFLKLYREEENLHMTVLLDCSRSMAFGQPDKFLYARQIAAAIAYIGMSNLDDANVRAFTRDMGPAAERLRGKGKVKVLFPFLTNLTNGGETDMRRAFRRYVALERRRGVVVLVSDLYDRDGVIPALRYLKSRRHEVFVIHVMDKDEVDPPLRGDLRLVDSETGAFKDLTVTDALRARYKEAFEGHARAVETWCRSAETGYVRALTQVPFDTLVLKILKRGGLVA